MCLTCGCGDETNVRVLTLDDSTAHEHRHDHGAGHHSHDHSHGPGHDHGLLSEAEHQALHAGTQTVAIEEAILAKNDHLAEHNRAWLADRGITALNLMSSPGSGKTSLLERTIAELQRRTPDLRHRGRPGDHARRRADPRAPGPAQSRSTPGRAAIWTPPMVQRALDGAATPRPGRCCSSRTSATWSARPCSTSASGQGGGHLGDRGRGQAAEVPAHVRAADLVIVNKTDLLPYVDFDLEHLRRVRPTAEPGRPGPSAVGATGDQVQAWYGWLADWRTTSAGSGRQTDRYGWDSHRLA